MELMEATMKLRSALICLSLMILAAPAFAQSLFLNHNECAASTSVGKNKILNCASTSLINTVVASVEVGPAPVLDVIADLGIVDMQVGAVPSGVMPDFWQFQSGGANGGSPAQMTFSADFSVNSGCNDMWAGSAGGGGQYGGTTGPIPDGNRARIKWTWAVFPEQAFDVPASTESYVSKFLVRQAKALTLAGCNTPVCCVYVEEQLALLAGGGVVITQNPDYVTFNDAGNASGCPGATPTKNKTWGQVKALYR
jgi:hypothetical protein